VVIVHAGVERLAGLALVVEPEGMTDLLADHVQLLGRVVVGVGAATKVVVVVLHGSLGDVAPAAVDPDLRDAEPTSVAVIGVAHLDASLGGVARRAILVARDDLSLQHRRLRPITRCGRQHAAPRLGRVVTKVDREWVGRAGPVVLAPGMVGRGGRAQNRGCGSHERCENQELLQSYPPFAGVLETRRISTSRAPQRPPSRGACQGA
jgi:hypothetical protein